MGISDSFPKDLARSDEAEPTITYPLLLNSPITNKDIKNMTLYFVCFRISF